MTGGINHNLIVMKRNHNDLTFLSNTRGAVMKLSQFNIMIHSDEK
jgi:hypothetical protein